MKSEEDNRSDLSDNDEYYDEEEMTWISWYCSQKGNEVFCSVEEEYIEDEFNLTSLSSQVPYYRQALNTILDIELDLDIPAENAERIALAAEVLYGLIHARYIITSRGLLAMADKYRRREFGTCPRYLCDKHPVLPVGMYDIVDSESLKLFCPSCQDVYTPRSLRQARVDGAYFGTTFPHLFFHTFPHLIPKNPVKIYTPRIFGFKIRNQ